MGFVGGVASQSWRNVTLEPWRGNTRSDKTATRAGEVIADLGFLTGGIGGAMYGAKLMRGGSNAWARLGGAAIALTGIVGAATGLKNLFAPVPKAPAPTPPKPDPIDPKPTPGPGPGPDPVDPAPTPDPDDQVPGGEPKPAKPPTPSRPPGSGTGEEPAPAPAVPAVPAEPALPAPVAVAPVAPVAPAPATDHQVKPGETLSFIAGCFDVEWRALYTYNRDVIGPNPDALRAGVTLQIPPAGYQAEPFVYRPQTKGGVLPPGLACDPRSPAAIAAACAAI